jgi:hypothetical protein
VTRRRGTWGSEHKRHLSAVVPLAGHLDEDDEAAFVEAPPEDVRKHLAQLAALVNHVNRPWRWIDTRSDEQKREAYARIDAVIRRSRRELAEEWAALMDGAEFH